MTLDPTSNIGKLRLRVGDYTDIPIFTDDVYNSAITDTVDSLGNPYLPNAALLMAQYILGSLSMQTHEKLQMIEVFGNLVFDQYVQFLKSTITNPMFMQISPIPYTAGANCIPPLVEFQKDWNNNYAYGTQSELLKITAIGALPDGFYLQYF